MFFGFGDFAKFLEALYSGKADEYIDAIIQQFDPVSNRKNAELVNDKVTSIAEYLHWKGENVYILRCDMQPTVYIVFPDGIKSDKIYKKLYQSEFITERQDESIMLMMYPRTEHVYNIIATILLSH